MWEYNRIIIKFRNYNELIKQLNVIGNDYWELINYEENKPEKFTKEGESIIIVKRKKY